MPGFPARLAIAASALCRTGVAIAFFAACLADAQAAAWYVYIPLEGLGGSVSDGASINATGQVAGSAMPPGGDRVLPVTWQGGAPTVLADLGGTPNYSWALGINDAGRTVGASATELGYRAVAWNGASVVPLDDAGGRYSYAVAINNAGRIVGAADSAADPGGPLQAAVWNGTTLTWIGAGLGASFAKAINGSGAIVGYAFLPGASFQHAVRWGIDGLTDLGGLGAWSSMANDVNDAGWAVGASDTAPYGMASHATLWTPGGAIDLGTLGGVRSVANAVNSLGQVVGSSDTAAGSSRATLWEGSSQTDLNAFLDAQSLSAGWLLSAAADINDEGWITGSARNSITGDRRAFLLIPGVPEAPSELLLFGGLGVVLLAARKARSRSSQACVHAIGEPASVDTRQRPLRL